MSKIFISNLSPFVYILRFRKIVIVSEKTALIYISYIWEIPSRIGWVLMDQIG